VPAAFSSASATEAARRVVDDDDDASVSRRRVAMVNVGAALPVVPASQLAMAPIHWRQGCLGVFFGIVGVFFGIVAAGAFTAYENTRSGAGAWLFLVVGFAAVLVSLLLILRIPAAVARQRLVNTGRPAAAAIWHLGWYCCRCAIVYFQAGEAPPGIAPRQPLTPAQFQHIVWTAGRYAKTRPPPYQVIAGLMVTSILAVIGVLFATNSNSNNSVPGGPPTPAPPCPKQATSSADPAHEATGPPPWTVEGYGIRYTVVSATRTTSEWAGATKPSITVTSCVTRIEPADPHAMNYRFSDAASSSALDPVPLQGSGDENPPLNQTSRLTSIVWDVAPSATHLTITLHDFFWPDSQNLTMQNVPVSPQS